MSDDITLNGARVAQAYGVVPGKGPWFVDVDLIDEAAELQPGPATLKIGNLSMVGTIIDGGSFRARKCVRLVAGGGGWSNLVPAAAYSNDAGVPARQVAEVLARAAGETFADFAPGLAKVGAYYLQTAGTAAAALEDAIRGASWWVGYDGKTRVGTRPTGNAAGYHVLDYDPRHGDVTLAVDDLTTVNVGQTLTQGLDTPLVTAALEFTITPEALRVSAWCPTDGGTTTQIADALVAIVEAAQPQLHGIYRYRVVNMSVDRVTLQIVRKQSGAPDALRIPQWPGCAGVWANLKPGSQCAVQFLDGDRTMPVITNFGGRDTPSDVPTRLEIGGPGGSDAARKGDSVECPLPPASFSGTIGGVPATGVLTFPLVKLVGVVTGGSDKVGIAT